MSANLKLHQNYFDKGTAVRGTTAQGVISYVTITMQIFMTNYKLVMKSSPGISLLFILIKIKNVDNIPPEEMNLSEFIIAARTKKGEQYEPSSLRGIFSSVYCYMYLARREYGKRLFIDPEFMRLRDTSKTKQKEPKKKKALTCEIFF